MSPDDDVRPARTPAPSPTPSAPPAGVRQLRLVVTVDDHAAALAFYRDALGMPELAAFTDPDGQVTILDAGRATLEITDEPHAAYIDRVEGVPAGRSPAGTTAGTTAGTAAGTTGGTVDGTAASAGLEPSDGAAAGARRAPRVRVAFEVTDAHGVTRRLEAAGAHVVAEPVRTPWDSLNARLDAPADLEVTVFQELGAPDVPPPA